MVGVAVSVMRWPVFLAWGVTAASMVGAYLLAASHGAAVWWVLVWSVPTLGCSSVGVLLCVRVPRNPISWLVLVLGVSQSIGYVCDAYSAAALALPAARSAAAAASLIEALPPFVFVPALLLLFPDGQLPSRRWRPAVMLAAVAAATGLLATLVSAGRLSINSNPPRDNPLGVGGGLGTLAGVVGFACFLALAGVIVAAAVSLVMRFRRATGDLREQLKWFGCGAALLGLAAAGSVPLSAISNVVGTLAWAIAATFTLAAVGVAVLRYRLYEVDVVIRKTLVYAALVAVLALMYLAGVYLIDEALRTVTGQSGSLAVAASTLAVAAAFQPLRIRIRRGVDHRFYRSKYDAARTLDAFTSRLREQIDLEALRGEILGAVHETLQPSQASLWLRPRQDH
jgi:hypothetical protein